VPGGLHPARRRGDPPSATVPRFAGSGAGKGGVDGPRRRAGSPSLPPPRAGSRSCSPRRSDDELGDFVVGEIQGEVFAGSFDGEGLLDVDALLGQAAIAVEPFLLQPVGAAEGVALGRVLAEVGQLQEVLLVEPNVIQAQAVPVR